MADSEEKLKSLDESERESEKPGLKLNIQKTKIMASSQNFMANRWGNNDRLFLGELQNNFRW